MSSPDFVQAVELVLNRHLDPPSHGAIKPVLVRDVQQGHFLLMHIGWNNRRRVHGVVAHVRVSEGRVWIEYDGILAEPSLAEQLEEVGVPAAVIVPVYWLQPDEPATPSR